MFVPVFNAFHIFVPDPSINPTWWIAAGFLQSQAPPKNTASPALRWEYGIFLDSKKISSVCILSFHRPKLNLLVSQLRLTSTIHTPSNPQSLAEQISTGDLANSPTDQSWAIEAGSWTAGWTFAWSTRPDIRFSGSLLCFCQNLLSDIARRRWGGGFLDATLNIAASRAVSSVKRTAGTSIVFDAAAEASRRGHFALYVYTALLTVNYTRKKINGSLRELACTLFGSSGQRPVG